MLIGFERFSSATVSGIRRTEIEINFAEVHGVHAGEVYSVYKLMLSSATEHSRR